MYLKKVEIQGFKSFADKTEIEFKNDVTAVVGPNGSGKSNISDAIRWVLGEQSVKNLRGTKMEDIIFSGTDKRRALGFAEVTITFDNKSGKLPIDYTEVAVTRRMFRSGESEYYLNKNSCRLKDVRELFMDSGIGKDGYSIIGQGKIDEILSSKPEDRRNIFEEAAGIIKYKTKKEEAERKLEKTESNIIRIKDLIHEVSSQKEILESESLKATQFTKYYSKLRELEVNLYIRDINKLDKQIKDVNIEKGEINSQLNTLSEEKNIIEEKFNLLKTNIHTMEKEIEESRTIKFDTIQSFEKNKNQISILFEKESNMNKNIDRLNKEMLEVEQSLKKLEDTETDLSNELDDLNIKITELQDEFRLKNLELERLDKEVLNFEESIDIEKNNLINHYNNASNKRSEINSINSFNDNIDKRVLQLKREIEHSNNSKDDLIIKDLELKKDETSLRKDYNLEMEHLNLLINDKSNIEKKNKNLNELIKENQIKLNGLNSSYNLFKNMEAGYEGYYKSVKGILEGAKKNDNLKNGLVGVVADLLKVEEIYERAIEISLGSNSQNIVVDTEEDAKKLVAYLKQYRLGRATFLPLNTIKGKSLKLDLRDKEEFQILGLGHELIKYDKKYQNIFEFLLGRTIIVKDIDFGIKLANKHGHIYRVVTLEGEVLNAGGSITGGSYGKDSISIINRKNKIESLTKDIEKTNVELANLEINRLSVEESLNNLDDEISKKERLIKSFDLKLYENLNNQGSIKNEIDRLDNEMLKKTSEIETLSKELDEFNRNKNYLLIDLKEIEVQIENIKMDIDLRNNNIQDVKNNRNVLNNEVTNIRISISNVENLKTTLEYRKENYYLSRDQFKNQIKDKINEIEIIKEELRSIETTRIKLQDEISTYEKSENVLTLELNELIKKKDDFMKTFYDEQDLLKVINKKISDIEKSKNNLEIKFARYELQYENNNQKLLDDYDLIFEEAIKLEKDIGNLQSAQSEVRELKENIKALGNVNIASIEEFKNVNDRLEFITTQHKDLISAKENLNEVIIDMEKNMRSQFINSFKEINENFTEVFSVLFNGGKARLELDDNEDILKSGIEIKVQPPGKKLQSLSLLSGGEKSLTAVALLFAILKTKPAPFCILDEIDAALDEANINRYTNFLKVFNDMTQFVLITHRKTTMEIADVLYGVTMEEEGVSRIISVKLKDSLVEAS